MICCVGQWTTLHILLLQFCLSFLLTDIISSDRHGQCLCNFSLFTGYSTILDLPSSIPQICTKSILCFQSLCVRRSYYIFLIDHKSLLLLIEQSCTGDVGLGALEKGKGISTFHNRRERSKPSDWNTWLLDSSWLRLLTVTYEVHG